MAKRVVREKEKREGDESRLKIVNLLLGFQAMVGHSHDVDDVDGS